MDGILVLVKPPGPTSHDVVALVRRLSGTRRVGHGGTLDPFASGVLPIFLGAATRLAEYHLGDVKRYRATICFGATSTTDDRDGELTPVGGSPDRDAFEAALARFLGPMSQRPPAYSAVQVGGRRAYAMARAGERPELAERSVTIHELQVLTWDDADPERPVAVVDVTCSAGTYVRALARDLGLALGSGAYLGALVRTASGPFRITEALDIDVLRMAAAGEGTAGVERLLLPIDTGLEGFARARLTADEVRDVVLGRPIRRPTGDPATGTTGPLLLVDEVGRVIGIGRHARGRIDPDKILVDRTRPADA